MTVTISTLVGGSVFACTYWPDLDPFCFGGPGNAANLPLNPANVSGMRFIRSEGPIHNGESIVFDFSPPVRLFGLTTIDLLEDSGSPADRVSLQALDGSGAVIDEHMRSGRQGPGGIDLDWLVSSESPLISRVLLVADLPGGFSGHGIDDLLLTAPPIADLAGIASCAYHCSSPDRPSNYLCLDLPQAGEGGVLPVEPRLYGGVGEHLLQIGLTGAAVGAVTVDASCSDGSIPVPTSLVEAVPGMLTVTFSPPLPNGECCQLTLIGGATGTAVIQILEGDVNQSGVVNATDKNLVKGKIGRALDAENFVYDVNMTGTINATDKFLVKAEMGQVAALCP